MPTRFIPSALARDELRAAIEQAAAIGQPFTRDNITRPRGCSDNQVGAAFRAAKDRGLIRQVGATRTRRRAGHHRQLAVWVGTGQQGGDNA